MIAFGMITLSKASEFTPGPRDLSRGWEASVYAENPRRNFAISLEASGPTPEAALDAMHSRLREAGVTLLPDEDRPQPV